MKKLLLIPLVIILIAGICLSGCGPKTVEGSVLTIARASFNYESMDPIVWESFWGWSMYDPLITFDGEGNIIGSVAESYSLSEDGLSWTFNIREGMTFHNGDPVTAHDVKFSVDRFAGEDSTNPWSPYLRANYDYTEVTGEYTFVYHCLRPEPPLATPFAWTRIIPKDYFESVGAEGFTAAPVGSGPWKFVSFVSETEMVMEAFEDHWREVPAFETLIEILAPEESTRIAMLQTGEVDIAEGISMDNMMDLQDEGFTLQQVGLPGVSNFSFTGTWLTDGPTSDINFRKAMSYAINRQEICDTLYYGLAEPGGRWFMSEQTWGWDPSWEADPYDPTLAESLLADAGYPDAFDDPVVTVWLQAGWPPTWMDAWQLIQGYWTDVGIQSELQVVDPAEWAMFFVRATSPDDQVVGGIFPWTWQGVFQNVYHCANMFTNVGIHSTSNDQVATDLYAEAISELDAEVARQLWTEFTAYCYDELWINVGLWIEPGYFVCDPDTVGDWTSHLHLSLWDAYAGIQQP